MYTDALATAGGRTQARLEPLHSLIYFAPESGSELGDLGLTDRGLQYFAQRSAAMGAVGPGVVAATFYSFNPVMVARAIPRAWSIARPADVVNVRYRAADTALRRLLGDAVESPQVQEAAGLARRAAEGAPLEDRALFAAHADVPWPEEAHLVLWHAATLLREHRGDGHLHALASAGLSGVESVVSHTATGRGFLPEPARTLRGWSTEQWGEAAGGLTERGLLTVDGALTPAGEQLRAEIEEHTDRLAAAPWAHLGVEGTARLQELVTPLSATVVAAGAFPDRVFAPDSGRARPAS